VEGATAGTVTEDRRRAVPALLVDPAQQRGDVGRDAGRCRKHGRIVGGPLVDDGQRVSMVVPCLA
jgi:hypothetical protein